MSGSRNRASCSIARRPVPDGGCTGRAGKAGGEPPACSRARGVASYLGNCWHCHGKRGLADGPLATSGPVPAPPLAGRVPDDTSRGWWQSIVARARCPRCPCDGPHRDSLHPHVAGSPRPGDRRRSEHRGRRTEEGTEKKGRSGCKGEEGRGEEGGVDEDGPIA